MTVVVVVQVVALQQYFDGHDERFPTRAQTMHCFVKIESPSREPCSSIMTVKGGVVPYGHRSKVASN